MQLDMALEIIILEHILFYEVHLTDMTGQQYKMMIYGEVLLTLMKQDSDLVKIDIIYQEKQNGLVL